jgi:Cu-Zn family superoxide dismutase
MPRNNLQKPLLGVLIAALLGACASMGGSEPRAAAQLQPTRGNKVTGNVTFSQKGEKVVVAANISGLKPNQEHGFHVHEKGDCSSGDGMSAGGHFNPSASPHGHPSSQAHHAGDMPNLKADAYGNANMTAELNMVSVSEGPTSVVGRGLIVHANPDDYKSQPVGNAGPRMACAVIQKT